MYATVRNNSILMVGWEPIIADNVYPIHIHVRDLVQIHLTGDSVVDMVITYDHVLVERMAFELRVIFT